MTRRIYRAEAYYEDLSLDTVRHFLTKRARDRWAEQRRAGYPADAADELFGPNRPAIPPALRVDVADSDPVTFPQDKSTSADHSMTELFRRSSERNKIKYKEFERDYCQGFDDMLDGFVIHTSTCPHYQDMASSGSACINYRHIERWPKGLSKIR